MGLSLYTFSSSTEHVKSVAGPRGVMMDSFTEVMGGELLWDAYGVLPKLATTTPADPAGTPIREMKETVSVIDSLLSERVGESKTAGGSA